MSLKSVPLLKNPKRVLFCGTENNKTHFLKYRYAICSPIYIYFFLGGEGNLSNLSFLIALWLGIWWILCSREICWVADWCSMLTIMILITFLIYLCFLFIHLCNSTFCVVSFRLLGNSGVISAKLTIVQGFMIPC